MTTPYAFDITLQTRPAEARSGPTISDALGVWPTLEVPKDRLASPMDVGFEAALTRLAAIERLYAEPDGSFVWAGPRVGDAPMPAWQVDGNAYDRSGRVVSVDLRGSCPPAEFDRLLMAFGWPRQPLMMQLVRAAVFLDETTFRGHAAARGRAGDGETLRPG